MDGFPVLNLFLIVMFGKVFRYVLTVGVAVVASGMAATAQGRVEFLNEAVDTTVITQILIEVDGMRLGSAGEKMAAIGRRFAGRPYKGGTLEGNAQEVLTIGTEAFDCTTFVETVTAMAMTLEGGRSSWRDVVYNLRQLRYRGGEVDGYSSRLHYISDWIIDNFHRGNLREVTDRVGPADYQVKTLDFMSHNREKYPALADSAAFAGIKNMEIGFRSHRYPYIKPMNIKKTALKEGDIVALTTSVKGLDVSHLGIIVIKDGKPHLMHASSRAGKVIEDPLTLEDYLKRNRTTTGIRVVRIME